MRYFSMSKEIPTNETIAQPRANLGKIRNSHTFIVRVCFLEPIDGETEFYFGSLKAIYQVFSPEAIGYKYGTLKNMVREGKPLDTPFCTISRHKYIRHSNKD